MQTRPDMSADDPLEPALIAISGGDRAALRDLFDAVAPAIAAHLAGRGVPQTLARQAMITTFAQIWSGEYAAPLRPGQPLADWLSDLALFNSNLAADNLPPMPPVSITPDLWAEVRRAAFPESWRNILRRMDLLFLVGGALVWAVLLRLLTP